MNLILKAGTQVPAIIVCDARALLADMELSHRITLCVSEGLVAGNCHGGKCKWLRTNVCRVR